MVRPCDSDMMTAGQATARDAGARKKEKWKTKEDALNVVMDDMQEVGAREDEVFDRSVWNISAMMTTNGKAEIRIMTRGP